MKPLLCAAAAATAASVLMACSDNPPATGLESAVHATLEDARRAGDIDGYAFEVGNGQGRLVRVHEGIAPGDIAAVASVAKPVSAVLTLALVDDGTVNLDDPIDVWLGADRQAAQNTTLHELLTHTHRLRLDGQHDCLNSGADEVDLQECADQILGEGNTLWQGFRYGAAGYQVAGAVAEAASGQSWQELVEDIVNARLGVAFAYLPAENPRIGGGLLASLDDLAVFQRALLSRDPALLSADAHATMRERRVAVDTAIVPDDVTAEEYAPGHWIDTPAGSAGPELSAPGALGSVTWLDDDRDYYAVLILQDADHETAIALMKALREDILSQLP